MSTWLSVELSVANAASAEVLPAATSSSPALRAFDLALAAALLSATWLPMALLAWLHGGFTRQPLIGRNGRSFDRLGLAIRRGRRGALLAHMGAAHWPVLINILRGELSWVGPRARAEGEVVPSPCLQVRPGLVNPWFIRSRTAVHFGTESQADLSYLRQRGLRHDLGLLLRGALVAALPGATNGPVPARVQLYDVSFDNVDMVQALNRVSALLDAPTATQVCFVNPACVNIAAKHRGYRRVLARAGLVLPDGIGIKIGTALLGTPLRQNVNGTDLFPRLCELLQARGRSVYLLGGGPGVPERVAAQIAQRWPQLRVAGVRHGFFSTAEEGQVVADVRASGADLLLVARGVPGQDLFVDRYLPQLGVKVAMGVGGLFDFVSGRISRAPVWMRETGLEWIWRLMQEPGRMWQRYLVGNFTFLGRVVVQRLGLRSGPNAGPSHRGAAAAAAQALPTSSDPARAVIFATTNVAADMPVAADCPVALMQLGHQTLIEQLLANLTQAGITQVDLVVSDRPDALRALLGDGTRWGLRLHWHLVKDPAHAYAMLDLPALRRATRVLIGHADRCPSVASLQALQGEDAWWVDAHLDNGSEWAGWGSLAPSRLPRRCADLSLSQLGLHGSKTGARLHLVAERDAQTLHSAADLLRAQPGADGALSPDDVPPSWIRKPWGAMSPQALVDERATLIGPVMIGPGCIVPRAAQLGPHVVLSKDVVVSPNTRIDRTLVMPGSYVGAGLDLSQCVVNGARVRHTRLGVETCLQQEDALMLSLQDRAPASTGWLGRALAAAVMLVAGPALAAHVLMRRAAGRSPAWVLRPVVTGRKGPSGAPETVRLRLAAPSAGPCPRGWSLLAGVVDITLGRRAWFGARPRSAGQWYAMRPEWQQMLAGWPVGLFHAPAWTDDPAQLAEAGAAADVFAVVLSPMHRALAALSALRHAASSICKGTPT